MTSPVEVTSLAAISHGWAVRLIQAGKLGFLARVLQPGEIAVGDAFELVEQPCPEANLVFVNRAKYVDDPDMARELAQLAPLAEDWRAKFAEQAAG
jgi:MOSC domain-containing protein YiiM